MGESPQNRIPLSEVTSLHKRRGVTSLRTVVEPFADDGHG